MQSRVFTWCPTPTKSTNRRGRGSQGIVTAVYDITKRNKSTPSIVSPSKMSTKSVFFLKNTSNLNVGKKHGKSATDGGWACSISQPFNGFYCVCIA